MGLWLGLGVVQLLQLIVSTLARVRKICKLRNYPQLWLSKDQWPVCLFFQRVSVSISIWKYFWGCRLCQSLLGSSIWAICWKHWSQREINFITILWYQHNVHVPYELPTIKYQNGAFSFWYATQKERRGHTTWLDTGQAGHFIALH